MLTANLPERDCEILGQQLDAFECDIVAARRTAAQAVAGVPFHAGGRPAVIGSRRGEHVRLPDGAEILIRPVEPDDDAALRSAFEHLGAVSRFRGSLTAVNHLKRSQLQTVTQVDHRSHEALVALDERTGELVGIAQYVSDDHDPQKVEAGVMVVDLWQRRGVGTALLRRLAERAAETEHRRLTATVGVGNSAGRHLLRTLSTTVSEQRVAGATRMTAALPLRAA
jgi:GNAT superfamily N-acetyltransferase